MDIVIIEDERLLADELGEMLAGIDSSHHVVAKLQSIEESVEWLQNNVCDLIFMDIQLSDGLSFSIFEKISVTSPVVFTTAFDQYAIRAFDVNSIAYLLKPIDEKELRKALDKHKFLKQSYLSNVRNLIAAYIPQQKEYKEQIVLTQGNLKKVVDIAQIAYFQADDRYVFAFTKSGQRLFCDYPLKELETMFNPRLLFRANRTFMIYRENIKGWSPHTKGRLKIVPQYGGLKEIIVSSARASDFKKWIDQ